MAKKKKHFDGTEGDFIEVSKSKEMVARFQKKFPKHRPRAHFFGKDVIQDLLDEPGCVGLRLYYALDKNERPQIILVGVNKDMRNILERRPVKRTLKPPKLKEIYYGTADWSHPGSGTDDDSGSL